MAAAASPPGTRALVSPIPAPDFTLAVDVVQDGTTLTYTIAFENVGTGPAKTAVLRDTLPAGSTFLGDPALVDNGVWTKTYANLGPGAYEEIVAVLLPDTAQNGDRVVNVVVLEYTGTSTPTVTRTHVVDIAVALPVPVVSAVFPTWIAAALPVAGGASLAGGAAAYRARRRPKMEQVFLMHNSGMLIHHWAANVSPSRDIDILSGMFVILKEFVRDSFREKAGGLTELQFGDSRMFLAEGRHAILAAVVSGRHTNGLPGQIAAAVKDFEARHGASLVNWTGQLDSVPEARAVVDALVRGAYGRGRVAG